MKDEALKLALEALTYLGLKPEGTCDVDKAAITSIKKAIAQQPEPRNFCPRCGKRTADLAVIHTCTPPRGLENT